MTLVRQRWGIFRPFYNLIIIALVSQVVQAKEVRGLNNASSTIEATIGDICQLKRFSLPHINSNEYIDCHRPTNDTNLWPWKNIGIWTLKSCKSNETYHAIQRKCLRVISTSNLRRADKGKTRLQPIYPAIVKHSNGVCTCPTSLTVMVCPCPGGGGGGGGGGTNGGGSGGGIQNRPRPCPFAPPRPSLDQPLCSWMIDPLMPDPAAPTSYMQCTPHPEYLYCGRWKQRPCAPKTVFSPPVQVCVFRDDENAPPVGPVGPGPNGGGPYPMPGPPPGPYPPPAPPPDPYPMPVPLPGPYPPPAPPPGPYPLPVPLPGPYPPPAPPPGPYPLPPLPGPEPPPVGPGNGGEFCGVGIFVGFCNTELQCPGMSQCTVIPIPIGPGGPLVPGTGGAGPPPFAPGFYPNVKEGPFLITHQYPGGSFITLQPGTKRKPEHRLTIRSSASANATLKRGESGGEFSDHPVPFYAYGSTNKSSPSSSSSSSSVWSVCCHEGKMQQKDAVP